MSTPRCFINSIKSGFVVISRLNKTVKKKNRSWQGSDNVFKRGKYISSFVPNGAKIFPFHRNYGLLGGIPLDGKFDIREGHTRGVCSNKRYKARDQLLRPHSWINCDLRDRRHPLQIPSLAVGLQLYITKIAFV
jgi:hypothetical protein